jgi:hypothetical protein
MPSIWRTWRGGVERAVGRQCRHRYVRGQSGGTAHDPAGPSVAALVLMKAVHFPGVVAYLPSRVKVLLIRQRA